MSLSGQWPRLLADIGGSNARFALESAPGVQERVAVLATSAYPSLLEAVQAYLAQVDAPALAHAAFGIATPIAGDWVQMSNHHWAFSIAALQQQLGLTTLLVINDFSALALALPQLTAAELQQVGGGLAQAGAPLALLGPGTGLGMAGLLPHASGPLVLSGEGGHAALAPFDEREGFIWAYAQQRFGHVSAERVLSGAGLVLIYQALAARAGVVAQEFAASEISRRGLADECAVCRETLEVFCAILGGVAANQALILGARGGVYIGGGIVPRLGDFFARSAFRQRFEEKGRMSHYVKSIPTYLITHAYPALSGVAALLSSHLAAVEVAHA
ncbi:glucokinase [Neisseriaceae bacterium TC5R-5]|nr:glucokinase [Neisseriaceae bacterium TC5R-5]